MMILRRSCDQTVIEESSTNASIHVRSDFMFTPSRKMVTAAFIACLPIFRSACRKISVNLHQFQPASWVHTCRAPPENFECQRESELNRESAFSRLLLFPSRACAASRRQSDCSQASAQR